MMYSICVLLTFTLISFITYYNFVQIPSELLRFYQPIIHEKNGLYYIYFRPLKYIPVYRVWCNCVYVNKAKKPLYIIYTTNNRADAERLLQK